MFQFLKRLFGQSDKEEQGDLSLGVVQREEEADMAKILQEEPKKSYGRETQLNLSSKDLMQMARKLTAKGEFYRAEQLIRDGVKSAVDDLELWWLLLEIEEPLNRKGRAYYCVEQIIEIDPENEKAMEKLEELKPYIDEQLNYFIEYKMAPEFYRLK